MTSSNRLFFLDNLRAFVVLLVIVLHACLTYMDYAPPWWYVVDEQTSLFFTALVLLIDVPIMQIMFFIAGYFALPSLEKRGAAAFMKDKWLRIGLPWLFGALFLTPPVAYLTYYSRNVPMGFLEFWRGDFWTRLYEQSVYWYLGVLFLFFAVLALIRRKDASGTARPAVPGRGFFAVFLGLTTAAFLVLNPFFGIDTWSNLGYIFVVQPVRVPLYVAYFCLGVYAWRRCWFGPDGYAPGMRFWLPAGVIAGLAYLALRLSPAAALPDPHPLVRIATAVLFNAYCLSASMASLAFFRARVNGSGPVWKSLSASSYGMYYFHPLILYPLAYAFTALTLPLWLKAPAVTLLGALFSWLFTARVVLKAPFLRDVF